MSSYVINPDTSAQSDIPAMSVVRAPAAITKGKGKGKAIANPMTQDTDYSGKPDMEADGIHQLCYRGERYQACTACINAGVICVNILNKKLDRGVCQNCKKRKSQCSASEDPRATVVKTEPSPSKTVQLPAPPTPRPCRKRTLAQLGTSP
jgi:hypothetical protein